VVDDRFGERQVGEPAKQGGQGDGQFGAGEPGAEAVVDASSTISVIRGSSARIRRMVNSRLSMRRIRVWSGGSPVAATGPPALEYVTGSARTVRTSS
jgi:hypothetical protein